MKLHSTLCYTLFKGIVLLSRVTNYTVPMAISLTASYLTDSCSIATAFKGS